MAKRKKKEKFQRMSVCYLESVHPGTLEQEVRKRCDEIRKEME